MSPHLLDLPTEILNQILTPLPTSSLLRFSETSHHARCLANANLHTLSLGVAPLSSPLLTDFDQSTTLSNPYAIWLHIPRAASYEYWTLLNFQSALVTSILKRHGTMLQHLEISVWALTQPMAEAIADLRALRTLSLRIESGIGFVRGSPRSRIAVEREEQSKAWELLTKSAPVWRQRLTALRLENCDLETEQLAVLMKGSWASMALGLIRCRYVVTGLWNFLAGWEGRGKLRALDVAYCGGTLGEEARGAIEMLGGLQSLNLYECQEQQPGEFERCNREVWHIPDFVAPTRGGYGENMIIEVDPEYMQ